MPEAIELESIRRLDVKPGETLVVTLPFDTTPHEANRIAELIRERVPDGVEVLVTTPGVDLTIVAAGPPHHTDHPTPG